MDLPALGVCWSCRKSTEGIFGMTQARRNECNKLTLNARFKTLCDPFSKSNKHCCVCRFSCCNSKCFLRRFRMLARARKERSGGYLWGPLSAHVCVLFLQGRRRRPHGSFASDRASLGLGTHSKNAGRYFKYRSCR